jgi:hypothetical protein
VELDDLQLRIAQMRIREKHARGADCGKNRRVSCAYG